MTRLLQNSVAVAYGEPLPPLHLCQAVALSQMLCLLLNYHVVMFMLQIAKSSMKYGICI